MLTPFHKINLMESVSKQNSKFLRKVLTTYIALPEEIALLQNYPNPFNPVTEIRFQLPEAENVSLKIYNMLGKIVRSFDDMAYDAGNHSIRWDGRNEVGSPVSSGVYIYTIQAGDFSQMMKMMLIR
jgi:hypothetical protein